MSCAGGEFDYGVGGDFGFVNWRIVGGEGGIFDILEDGYDAFALKIDDVQWKLHFTHPEAVEVGFAKGEGHAMIRSQGVAVRETSFFGVVGFGDFEGIFIGANAHGCGWESALGAAIIFARREFLRRDNNDENDDDNTDDCE